MSNLLKPGDLVRPSKLTSLGSKAFALGLVIASNESSYTVMEIGRKLRGNVIFRTWYHQYSAWEIHE